MTKTSHIVLNAYALGFQSLALLAGLILNNGFLIVWCAAFAVYHAIRLRGLLKSGVEL